MFNERINTFETNSSSTHAICITKERNIIVLPDKINFKLTDYGREFQVLREVDEKASFLYTAIMYLNYCNDPDIISINDFYAMFDEINCNFINDGERHYIDGINIIAPVIKRICRNKNKLYRFLFHYNSFIIIGSDERSTDYDKIEDIIIHAEYPNECYYG